MQRPGFHAARRQGIACGQADFPIFPGNFLSASVGNRAAVEHSPVVCPFRVWVTKCVVRMLVGRQISHISLHFLLTRSRADFLENFRKCREKVSGG